MTSSESTTAVYADFFEDTNRHESPRNSGLRTEETKEVERQRSPVPPKKSKEHLYGHSH